MPRIPEISAKEQLPEDQRHIWDEIAGSRGAVQGPFRLMLHNPEIAGRVAHVGTYFRFEGGLDPALREMAILTTARAMDCVYIFAVHQAAARAAGVSQATISAVDQHRPDELAPNERWVYDTVNQLVAKHRIPKELYESAQTKLGVKGLVELFGLVGYYSMLATTFNAFEMEAPPG